MLAKILLTLLILTLVWFFLFRKPRPRRTGGAQRRLPGPLQMVRCPHCGVYRLSGQPCDCARPPEE